MPFNSRIRSSFGRSSHTNKRWKRYRDRGVLRMERLEDRSMFAAGDLDPSFGTGGLVLTDFGSPFPPADQAFALAIQPDGKIVVGGSTWYGAGEAFALARYNSDGSLDTSFGSFGTVVTRFGLFGASAKLFSLAIQPDGKIVAAGTSHQGVTGDDFTLARYNSDGSLDASFSGDGMQTTDFGLSSDILYSIAIQVDGKIVAVGASPQPDSAAFAFAMARYNSDGSLDTTFSTDGKGVTDFGSSNDLAYSVGIQVDGKIVTVGYSYQGPSAGLDFAIARFDTNGSLDTSFSDDGKATTGFGMFDDYASSVAIQSDGRIVAAGSSNLGPFAGNDFALVRYNSDGSLDTTFSDDGKQTTRIGSNALANSIAIQSDGRIVTGGLAVQTIGTGNDFALARYNTDGSLDTSFSDDGVQATDFGFSAENGVSVALQADGKIVLAGSSEVTDDFFDFAVARYLAESDAPSTVSIAASDATGSEPGFDDGVFTVSLSQQSATPTTVFLALSGTAMNGADYALTPLDLIIPANTSSVMINVNVLDDASLEGAETVVATLISTDNSNVAVDPATNSAIVSIADDEVAIVSVFATDPVAGEPANDGLFILSLSQPSVTDTKVFYTVSGTATGGLDYISLSGTVTIPFGTTSATILVDVLDDALIEPPETVVVTLTGTDNPAIFAFGSATVSILDNDINQPPTLSTNTGSTVAEGGTDVITSAELKATDPDTPAASLLYFVTIPPANGTLKLNGFPTSTFTQADIDAGNVTYVHNGNGESDTFTFNITDGVTTLGGNTFAITVLAVNAPPVITSFSNNSHDCGMIAEGHPVTVAGTFTDADATDTHSATINWGDGTPVVSATITEGGGSGSIGGSHVYPNGGIYTIVVTLVDGGGASSTATTQTVIVGAGVVGNTLYVVGTTEDDHVSINTSSTGFKVHADFFAGKSHKTFPAASVNELVVLLCEGNDHATISGSIHVSARIDGSAGNDFIKGGGGNDAILGSEGHDLLLGGGGRDLLIGGEGSDGIYGGNGDDILIAGRVAFADRPEAVKAIMAEWTSSRDYVIRIANLLGTGTGVRANGEYFLQPGHTVLDDTNREVLLGGLSDYDDEDDKRRATATERDWYFADTDKYGTWVAEDVVVKKRGEVVTEI